MPGYPGSGRRAAVRRHLEAHAAGRPAPSDCCCAYGFSESQRRQRRRVLAQGFSFDELKQSFASQPDALTFLREVLQEITEAGEQLRTQASGEEEEAE